MAQHPLLPFMEAHCKLLNKSLKEVTVDALRSLFGHVYYIWRTFKPALGEEDGLKYYGNVWAELAKLGFAGAMAKFGLKESQGIRPHSAKSSKIVSRAFPRSTLPDATKRMSMSGTYSGAPIRPTAPTTTPTAAMITIGRKST